MHQRKKQPQVTRQAILDAAGEGFSRVGYAASGLGGIVARAALTKGALFHHFPDKRSLAKAWIDERLAAVIAELWLAPLEHADSLEALRSLCRLRFNELQPGDATSALSALAAELPAHPDPLGLSLEQIFEDWRGTIARLLERGKTAGRIHRSIKPTAEAAFLVALIAGVTVTAKSPRHADTRRACLTSLEDYLDTLRSQPA
ncbi:MAG: TetR/AcrR family transcriptional regulator [Verrucomicrobia bacterium]|nr:TetR/AcrR family transcriptional regulator [Verrucomicrobiota bacterium]